MILVRFAYLPTGTLGRLHSPEGQVQLYTVERPWLGNQRYVSCIPEGMYVLKPFNGARWKGVLEVCDVTGRSAILIHPANIPQELAGCIAPGLGFSFNQSTPTVQESRQALTQVMDWYAAGDTTLDIQAERAVLSTPHSPELGGPHET